MDKNTEQTVFEMWLVAECPSGDADQVHSQWINSHRYAEVLEDDEIERLRGERDVYVRWVRNALLLLETIDPDEQEDGGEYHRMFMEHGADLVKPNVGNERLP